MRQPPGGIVGKAGFRKVAQHLVGLGHPLPHRFQLGLRRAQAELCWLLDRGYAMTSSLELVGNRHGLTQRQRLALARSACSAEQQRRRSAHEVPIAAVAGADLVLFLLVKQVTGRKLLDIEGAAERALARLRRNLSNLVRA